MKVLISKKTGNYYYYRKGTGDYHTKEGYLAEEELNSSKSVICTANQGGTREFMMFDANDFDKIKKFKRGPQMIQAKDLGYVVGRTRINKKSKVVESGSGMGVATTFFASLVDKVVSYEIKEEHHKIAQKNVEMMEIDNVELINGDINDEIENQKDIDLLFLDMLNTQDVLKKDLSGIKSGRYIVCYVPSITQIQALIDVVKDSDSLYLEEITEIIARNWTVWEKVARPNHRKEIDHTAFLVFIRKY